MKTSTRSRVRRRTRIAGAAGVLAVALVTAVLTACGAPFGIAGSAQAADLGPWTQVTKSARTSDLNALAQTIWNFDGNHPAAPYSPERFVDEVFYPDLTKSNPPALYQYSANQGGFCIAAPAPGSYGVSTSRTRLAWLVYDSMTKTVDFPTQAVWQGTSSAFDPCAIWSRQMSVVASFAGASSGGGGFETFVSDDPNYDGPANNQNSDYSLPDYIVSKGGTVPSVDAAPSGAKVWPLPKAAQSWACDAYCTWVEKATGSDPRTFKKVGTPDAVANFQYTQYQMMSAESDAVTHYVSTHPSGGEQTWLAQTQRAYNKTVTRTVWLRATQRAYRRSTPTYKRRHTLAQYRRAHTLAKYRKTNSLAKYRKAHPYKGGVAQPTLVQVAKDPAVSYYADNLPTGQYAAYYPTVVAWAPASWLKAHPSVSAANAYCIAGNTLGTGLKAPQAIWVSGLDRYKQVVPGIGNQPTGTSNPCSSVSVDTSALTPKSDTAVADPVTNLPVGYQPAN